MDVESLKALLGLEPLPEEGGFYRETYRSKVAHGDRAASTAIYYMITAETSSAMHRLPTDEVFHFYLGDPVEMLQLWPDGSGRLVTRGVDFERGQRPQLVVPAGVWQGSRLVAGGQVALMGTTMAPGFDFADYEGGQRAALVEGWPDFAQMIADLTG